MLAKILTVKKIDKGEFMAQNKNLFSFHLLNEQGKAKAEAVATEFVEFYKKLESLIGPEPSRYHSMVDTKLEEAAFFAKKAIANKSENNEAVSHQLD